jgi:phage-related protein
VQPAIFHTKAREAIRDFPREARRQLGEAIFELERGNALTMPLVRPMPAVGAGVHELRVRDRSGIYRAFYVVKLRHGILVFHAFEKKTQRTPPHEIKLGKKRLREMIDE